jgi:anthranilate phosphoribosyltransferase
VSDRRYQETIAEALVNLGCEHALVVYAEDGLDELSVSGRTRVIEVAGGSTDEWFAEPGDFGLHGGAPEDIAGGSPVENAATVRRVFEGEAGPARDVVALNGGAAIYAAGAAEDLASGVAKAQESLDSGAAAGVLERLVKTTGTLSGG